MLYSKSANQVSPSEFSAQRYLDHAREEKQTAHDYTKLELDAAINKMNPQDEGDRQTYKRIMSHNRNLDHEEYGRAGGDDDSNNNNSGGAGQRQVNEQ